MIELYLINGTGGSIPEPYFSNLKDIIISFEIAEKNGFLHFEHSLDEDFESDPDLAEDLLKKITQLPSKNLQLIFVHKNDLSELIELDSLPEKENARIFYFTTVTNQYYENRKNWQEIEQLLEEISSIFKKNEPELIIRKFFLNRNDQNLKKDIEILFDWFDYQYLEKFHDYNKEITKMLWSSIMVNINSNNYYTQKPDIYKTGNEIILLSKVNKESIIGIKEKLLILIFPPLKK